MSTRKSFRQKKVPDRYIPPLNKKNTKEDTGPPVMTDHQEDNKTTTSDKTTSSRSTQLRIELEKLEEISRLEKELELKEMERQNKLEEMERQKKLDEMERQQRELERQRKMEQRELERQKRLIELRTELKSASVSSRRDSMSEVGSSISIGVEDESGNKVENWLNDREQTSNVPMSSSALMSSAVEKLADSFREAISSNKPATNSLRQHLPTFGGKPEDWPFFYSTYIQTRDSFSEEDNLIRLRNSLEGDAFKMVKP
jgi:hypothetical protein